MYVANNLNIFSVWSWKMSRTPSLTEAAVDAINAKIATINVLNNRYYQRIDQSDAGCFYFPEPKPGTTVKFRGRCDESIPVVQNFNATRVSFPHCTS
jgi:retinol-binding protein 4